jgi:hypothetical protein
LEFLVFGINFCHTRKTGFWWLKNRQKFNQKTGFFSNLLIFGFFETYIFGENESLRPTCFLFVLARMREKL